DKNRICIHAAPLQSLYLDEFSNLLTPIKSIKSPPWRPRETVTEEELLSFVSNQGSVKRSEIEKFTGKSRSSVNRILKDLETRGEIQRRGKAKRAHYIRAHDLMKHPEQTID